MSNSQSTCHERSHSRNWFHGFVWLRTGAPRPRRPGIIPAGVMASPAVAQTQQQIEWCENTSRAFSPDRQIDGCTAAIRSGDQRSQKELASYFNSRGLAYRAKGDFDQAVADFDEAIRLEPKGAAAFLNNRGLARHSMNDYDGAIAGFDEVIRLAPNYALAYYNRANAYRVKGDNDRAISDYTDTIRLEPNFVTAYYNRGVTYRAKGDSDRAIADYTE